MNKKKNSDVSSNFLKSCNFPKCCQPQNIPKDISGMQWMNWSSSTESFEEEQEEQEEQEEEQSDEMILTFDHQMRMVNSVFVLISVIFLGCWFYFQNCRKRQNPPSFADDDKTS